jgi:plastocyanin
VLPTINKCQFFQSRRPGATGPTPQPSWLTIQQTESHLLERKMPQIYTIDIVEMAFPENTGVKQGDTVVWANRMNMVHTITADDGQFDSGVIGQDQAFSQVFETVGTIDYHCEIHPNMVGRISVSVSGAGA